MSNLPRAVQNGMSMAEYATWIFLADKEASTDAYTYIIKQSDLTHFLADEIEKTLLDLESELREYHNKYPDANWQDLMGYIAGFRGRPAAQRRLAEEQL